MEWNAALVDTNFYGCLCFSHWIQKPLTVTDVFCGYFAVASICNTDTVLSMLRRSLDDVVADCWCYCVHSLHNTHHIYGIWVGKINRFDRTHASTFPSDAFGSFLLFHINIVSIHEWVGVYELRIVGALLTRTYMHRACSCSIAIYLLVLYWHRIAIACGANAWCARCTRTG